MRDRFLWGSSANRWSEITKLVCLPQWCVPTFLAALFFALFDFLDELRLMGFQLIDKLLEFVQITREVALLRVERWQ